MRHTSERVVAAGCTWSLSGFPTRARLNVRANVGRRPGQTGPPPSFISLISSIVALLDLADEHLGCSGFVIALEKKSTALAGLIHSLMYVSGQVVSRPPFVVDSKFVLVGIEI